MKNNNGKHTNQTIVQDGKQRKKMISAQLYIKRKQSMNHSPQELRDNLEMIFTIL